MPNPTPVSKLFDFIKAAQHSRKYTSQSASAYKYAIKAFEPYLREEESGDISLLVEHLDDIARDVFEKEKIAASSLEEYKRRIKKVVIEYRQYGEDPSKMNNWNPTKRKTFTKKKSPKNFQENSNSEIEPKPSQEIPRVILENSNKWELFFGNGRGVSIITPIDLTKEEAKRIRKYIELIGDLNED